MNYDGILVSCLMVTLPSERRFALFRQSLADYCRQTHPRRELVIVLDAASEAATQAIFDHVAQSGHDHVRVIAPQGAHKSLGALRNLSRAHARGEVQCNWDDDDLNHPDRIRTQLEMLMTSGTEATALQETLHFFTRTRELYWTNWRPSEATVLPSTLMFRSECTATYPEQGPRGQLGEDTEFCLQLLDRDGLRGSAEAPGLFIYVSHGDNSWGENHHAMLAERLSLSRGLMLRRKEQITEYLRAFDLGPAPVSVRGPNGVAFTVP